MIQPQPAKPYYPGADTPAGELEVQGAFYPLAEKARAHIDRRVTVHLAGGDTSLVGLLTDVDTADVLTVVDDDDVYEIDPAHVAVLETKRQR